MSSTANCLLSTSYFLLINFHPEQTDFRNGVIVVVRFVNVVEVESELCCFDGLDVRVLHSLDILKVEALLESVLGFDGERAWLLENAEAVAEGIVNGFLVTNGYADVRDERVLVEVHGKNWIHGL